MKGWLLSPLGGLPVTPDEPHRLTVTEDAQALLVANGWTPPSSDPYVVRVELTKAELVSVAGDLVADARAKIGPRLTGARKLVEAARALVDEIGRSS